MHMVWFSYVKNYSFGYSGTVFYLVNLGLDCSVTEIVSELEECKAAATKLGRKFNQKVRRSDRPAGCYYKKDNNYFMFNLAKRSDTQNIASRTGGVCKRGISHISLYTHIV